MANSVTVIMSKSKKYKTKKPSGLALARNGASFVATWKIGDTDYGFGQSFDYRVKVNGTWNKWNSESVTNKATKKGFSVTQANYYPSTSKKLNSVEFRVQGCRKIYTDKKDNDITPTVSDWVSKAYTVKIPNKPTLSAALSGSSTNITTFTWKVDANAAMNEWAYDVEYEHRLIKNCKETSGPKAFDLKYVTGQRVTGTSTNLNSSITVTEDTVILASGSHTRWMRIRARGPAGYTDWVYAKHVYAVPPQAKKVTASAKKITGGMQATVEWTADATATNPISGTTVEYAIVTPGNGLAYPSGQESAWAEANVSADTSGKDKAVFTIGDTLDVDECLYVRVNTKWDRTVTKGAAVLAMKGTLSTPTALSVTVNDETHSASVSATNESDVPDSFLVVLYRDGKNATGTPVGIIAHGQSSTTCVCPTWASGAPKSFAVYAAQGSYTATTRGDGVTTFALKINMKSATLSDGGTVPAAPGSPTVELTDIPGTIRVKFTWAWTSANAAEISWADHADAWESTSEPNTYIISNINASQWNISGLETGKTWYVRIRLLAMTDDDTTYGMYTDILSIDLASAPAVTELQLSAGAITEHGTVTAAWTYVSNDGTGQSHAEIAEYKNNTYVAIAHAQTAQHIDLSAEAIGWAAGETHLLSVRVTSASGNTSGWSDLVPLAVVEPITAAIYADSLEAYSVTADGITKTVNALTEMPMTITVTGAGDNGNTTVVIERAAAYHVSKPDEDERYSFEGETIVLVNQIGEGQITISNDMLIGTLDDGAQYRIVATISDSFGQTDTVTKDFEVHWEHQAAAPTASVTIDEEKMVAQLVATAPASAAVTDVCDIYRLSVDKPELIYPGAEFGETYVDPYPTIGTFGGYRFVTRTANGDYIDEDDQMAWADMLADDDDDVLFDTDYNVIDFGTGRVLLLYEIDLSNTWTKNFTQTQYLGGSIQGDWNPGVKRSASVNGVAISEDDADTIEAMRRLAVWPGICHIRTKDGSSYAADVQVKENYKQSNAQRFVYFTLTVTRVDPDGYDGMTLEEWEATQEEEA